MTLSSQRQSDRRTAHATYGLLGRTLTQDAGVKQRLYENGNATAMNTKPPRNCDTRDRLRRAHDPQKLTSGLSRNNVGYLRHLDSPCRLKQQSLIHRSFLTNLRNLWLYEATNL